MQLTTAQYETLQAIEDLISEVGYSPSLREIMLRCGLKSPAPVQSRIDGLISAGAISCVPKASRTLQVLVPSAQFDLASRVKGDRVPRYQQKESIAQ